MRIIVFGASGNCGGHFVRLAGARGHAVTAVVRAGSPFPSSRNISVATGDVLDAAFVRHAVPGHDAVMSGLGMRYRHPWAERKSPDDFISRATANIVAAMQAAGVPRISIIANGVGDSRPRLTDRYPATATIPREDVAAFILSEIERPQFTATTPQITVT